MLRGRLNFSLSAVGALQTDIQGDIRFLVVMRSNRCMRTNWQPEGMSINQLKERGCSTLDEYIAALDARRLKRDALNEYIARSDISGREKGWARCQYILQNLRLPFQCPVCWLLPGHCICSNLRKAQVKTKVVVHLHPDEWAKGSNTGCLCSSLSGCELLMKGHKDHDLRLQQLLTDPHYTCAILWPGKDALEPHELQQLAAERSKGRIAVIAVDATWDGARKMRSKYPSDVHMLKLPPHLALPSNCLGPQNAVHATSQLAPSPAIAASTSPTQYEHLARQSSCKSVDTSQGSQQEVAQACEIIAPKCKQRQQQEQQSACSNGVSCNDQPTAASSRHPPAAGDRPRHSLFRPLRKYHGDAAENGRVCTLEAVAAALLALEGDQQVYEGLLYNLRLKVDAMRRQKHIGEVYGTSAAGALADC